MESLNNYMLPVKGDFNRERLRGKRWKTVLNNKKRVPHVAASLAAVPGSRVRRIVTISLKSQQ